MTDHTAPRGNISSQDALDRLIEGNEQFLRGMEFSGDITPERRMDAAENGQHPYAAIVSCSDSRVIPEAIFSAGIGDLFVIRTAGNIVDDVNTMGSLMYAVKHMGCNLVVVMGHTSCGAVTEAVTRYYTEHDIEIINRIIDEIGGERNIDRAAKLSVVRSVRIIREDIGDCPGLKVMGAMYDIRTGKADFFDP
jgi:carbonic anhydrase